MSLWEFRGVYRTKERKRGNVEGRRTRREREDEVQGKGERAEGRRRQRKRHKEKTDTYPWLMALCI